MPSLCFIPSPQSTFYTDRFLIILVILVILAIQVNTIFLEITIAPYQCCQSYLKSSTTCSKVTIKKSSRELFVIWIITISLHSGNSTKTALLRIKDKILFKTDNYELTGLVFVDFHKAFVALKKIYYWGNYLCTVPAQMAWLGFNHM